MTSEKIKRFIIFILGIFFSGLGIAFTKVGELGVSPVSSIPNILSIKFPFFTIGTWLIIWQMLLIIGEILILRKEFKLYQLFQIPLAFILGYCTDFGVWLLSYIKVDTYVVQLIMVVAGVVVLAFGIALTIVADLILNSGEAFVKVVSDKLNKNFGNVKITLDITYVTVSIVLSLIFFDFQIKGAREGTIIAAVFTGMCVKIITKLISKPLKKYIEE